MASTLLHFVYKPYISGSLDTLDYFYNCSLMGCMLFGMAFSLFTQYDPEDRGKVVREGLFPKSLDWLKDDLDFIAVGSVAFAMGVTWLGMVKELFKKYSWKVYMSARGRTWVCM